MGHFQVNGTMVHHDMPLPIIRGKPGRGGGVNASSMEYNILQIKHPTSEDKGQGLGVVHIVNWIKNNKNKILKKSRLIIKTNWGGGGVL